MLRSLGVFEIRYLAFLAAVFDLYNHQRKGCSGKRITPIRTNPAIGFPVEAGISIISKNMKPSGDHASIKNKSSIPQAVSVAPTRGFVEVFSIDI
jgi:hypothetical protein